MFCTCIMEDPLTVVGEAQKAFYSSCLDVFLSHTFFLYYKVDKTPPIQTLQKFVGV